MSSGARIPPNGGPPPAAPSVAGGGLRAVRNLRVAGPPPAAPPAAVGGLRAVRNLGVAGPPPAGPSAAVGGLRAVRNLGVAGPPPAGPSAAGSGARGVRILRGGGPPAPPAAAPVPPGPNFASWDSQKSHHASTRQAVQPLMNKWASLPRAPSAHPLTGAVAHMEDSGRFFSHELPSQYIAHAIGQGGVQSGYNTSLALGLPEPRHDKGMAAAAFVFTRQIPQNRAVKTRLGQGQVGASTDAMLVFRPSAFADPAQPAFFKTVDGAHHSPSIMPEQARKGDHIHRLSNEIAASADKTFHANQEQGLHGAVPLHHLAAVVLKTRKGGQANTKAAFVNHLHTTFRGDVLPPLADRRSIKSSASAQPPTPAQMARKHEAFQNRVVGQSLHDHLEALANVDTNPGARRRQVSELVVPLSLGTRRVDLPGHMPPRPSGVPIHERISSLGQPNAAFFKPRR